MDRILSSDQRTNLQPRDSPFDSTHYYTFHNDVLFNKTLSAGINQDSKGAVSMNQFESYSSSENWILHPQGNRFFIRNYDYGGNFQLGITDESKSIPSLIARSGDLGQQWILSQWEDGTWKFVNALLGNGSYLALNQGNTIPGLQTSENGAKWGIEINPSAGTPSDQGMLSDVKSMEPDQLTSSSSAPSATRSAISGTGIVGAGQSTTSGASSIQGHKPDSSSSLDGGQIAGIVVGGIAGLAFIIGLICITLWRKRQARQKAAREAVPVEKTVYAYRAQDPVELASEEVAGEMPTSNGEYYGKQVHEERRKTQRYELG